MKGGDSLVPSGTRESFVRSAAALRATNPLSAEARTARTTLHPIAYLCSRKPPAATAPYGPPAASDRFNLRLMSAIAPLISDLAIILVAAGCSTLVFKGLRQPVILGYIVAGVLAGPSVSFIPTVSDASSIRVWADIGVIFLLFAMGLEFSFRKLLSVGGTAVTAAVTIVAGMMFVGYGTGMSLGFSHMSSIFLGGMLSMSSTAIVFKAFDDMGLRGQRFTGVVLGILVVEDLVGVVLMVLLSTLAVSKQFEGAEMLGSILKLGAFLIFWSLLGIYLIPTLLKRLQRLLNDETLLIVTLGLCLGMVMIAVKAGFSAALGAFVMGSLLAETVAAERITRLVEPVKNFGAIFFVSVGMMIEPALLVRYAGPIVLLTVVVLAGQATFATLGVLVSGQPLRVAVQSGFSLTQVGEFAFIIATLGTTLHVTDDYLYPVIVAVSVVTTFLTPYMMRAADPACDYLERHLPAKWQRSLARYASGAGPESRHNTWLRLLRRMMLPGALYLVFCIFAEAAFLRYAAPWIEARIPGRTGAAVSLAAILAVLAPILLVVLRQGNRSPEFRQLWNDSKFNRGPLVSLILIKCLLCIGILMTVVASLFDTASGMGFAVSLALLTGIVFSKRLRRRSFEMEERLRENFGGDDTADFRRRYGVTVVAIRRGERRLQLPDGHTMLFPYDRLTVVGTDEEFRIFHRVLDEQRSERKRRREEKTATALRIGSYTLPARSALDGTTLGEAEVRRRASALVLGIERPEGPVTNPSAGERLRAGDVVWAVGDPQRMKPFFEAVRQE